MAQNLKGNPSLITVSAVVVCTIFMKNIFFIPVNINVNLPFRHFIDRVQVQVFSSLLLR